MFQVWVQLMPFLVEFPALYSGKHEHWVDWRLGTTVGIPREEPVTWMELDSWCNVSTARSPRCYEVRASWLQWGDQFIPSRVGMLVGGVGMAPCCRMKPEMRKTKFPKGQTKFGKNKSFMFLIPDGRLHCRNSADDGQLRNWEAGGAEKVSAATKKRFSPNRASRCTLASETFVLELTPAPLLRASKA